MLVTTQQLKRNGANFGASYLSKLTGVESYAVHNGALNSLYCTDKIEKAISLKREFVLKYFDERKKNYLKCFKTTQSILDAIYKIKDCK
jgi:hypothetical protein